MHAGGKACRGSVEALHLLCIAARVSQVRAQVATFTGSSSPMLPMLVWQRLEPRHVEACFDEATWLQLKHLRG